MPFKTVHTRAGSKPSIPERTYQDLTLHIVYYGSKIPSHMLVCSRAIPLYEPGGCTCTIITRSIRGGVISGVHGTD